MDEFENNNGNVNENTVVHNEYSIPDGETVTHVPVQPEVPTVIPEPEKGGVAVVSSKKKKKDNRMLVIVAACALCLLIGGIVGGIISASSAKKTIRDMLATTQASDSNAGENNMDVVEKPENEDVPDTPAVTPETTTAVKPAETAKKQPLSAREIYANNVNSVVSIEAKYRYGKGYGTGFIINDKGYIATNYHVVNGADSVLIVMRDETQYDAKVVGYEENNDIAVLKINADKKIDSVSYGLSANLKVGDPLYIIGNPLGDLTFTLTTGVVSALNRLITGEDGMIINMFQTDAAVNSGNSGGPVFNEYGNVVGIASAKYAAASIEGLSFCIPIDDVMSMMEEIMNKGYVSGKPLLNISVYDKVVSSYGFIQSTRSIQGAKIAALDQNGAAAKAGLQVDDIITAIDGKKISSVSELKTLLTSYRSGDTVKVTYLRGSTEYTSSVKFDEYEPTSPRTNYSNVYDL